MSSQRKVKAPTEPVRLRILLTSGGWNQRGEALGPTNLHTKDKQINSSPEPSRGLVICVPSTAPSPLTSQDHVRPLSEPQPWQGEVWRESARKEELANRTSDRAWGARISICKKPGPSVSGFLWCPRNLCHHARHLSWRSFLLLNSCEGIVSQVQAPDNDLPWGSKAASFCYEREKNLAKRV